MCSFLIFDQLVSFSVYLGLCVYIYIYIYIYIFVFIYFTCFLFIEDHKIIYCFYLRMRYDQ